MPLELLLQISMAAFAALGTILLGLGEGSAVLPVLAVVVSIASVYVTDVKGWLRLNRLASDVLGVAAMGLSMWNWSNDQDEGQLLALVNFVVYVQFVLLFRQKTTRSYWLLALLSVLQVAVATALNEQLEFGALMLAYLAVGLTTMTLFFLHRESIRYSIASSEPTPERSADAAPAVAARWPLGPQRTTFVAAPPVGRTEAGLNRDLVRHSIFQLVATLAITLLLFLCVPRLEKWSRPAQGDELTRTVGFSAEVTLGELGPVIESPEEVMRVTLSNDRGPIWLSKEPLFRGAVLITYTKNKWSRSGASLLENDIFRGGDRGAVVHQEIDLQPLDTPAMFSIFPPAFEAQPQDDNIVFDKGEQLLREGHLQRRRRKFHLLTTGIREGRQLSLISSPHRLAEHDRKLHLQLPFHPPGEDPLKGLRAVAQEVVKDIPSDDVVGRAQALESFLRDSPEFQYELQPVERDPALDPIEDFVTRHRVGHCEFFASALALMLRAVDIPSRLIVGFKGGEWNDSYYLVRNLHAHAWVEAYIPPGMVPAGAEDDGAARRKGAWLVLDPTTGGGGMSGPMPVLASMSLGFRQFVGNARTTWATYVLGMDAQRQRADIYQPLANGLKRFGSAAVDGEFWALVWEELARLPERWGLANGGWFSWRGAIAAMSIMLVLSAIFYGTRALVRLVLRSASRRRRSAGKSGVTQIEFYRRLEGLLARYELVRSPSQTQREFALASGGQLAEANVTKGVAGLPRQIVEAFYKVRFGRRSLDNSEVVAVEQALAQLATSLERGPSGD